MHLANTRSQTFRAKSATPSHKERPYTYKHWSEESMKIAYSAVIDNERRFITISLARL